MPLPSPHEQERQQGGQRRHDHRQHWKAGLGLVTDLQQASGGERDHDLGDDLTQGQTDQQGQAATAPRKLGE